MTGTIKLRKLRENAKRLEPAVRIGKNGLTDGAINEIKRQLEKKELVKVKLFKSFVENKNRKSVAEDIAEKTDSAIIDHVGFVIVLKKSKVYK